MSRVQGSVKKVTETTKNGRTYFGVVLEDNDELYRHGTDRPRCRVGDVVEFETNQSRFGLFVKDGTLNIVGNGSQPTTGGNGKSYTKDQYWAAKELRDIETQKKISFNGAHNAALKFVELALANGAITLGAGKAAAKFEVLKEIVDKVTRDNFVDFQTKFLELEQFNAEEHAIDPEGQDSWSSDNNS